MPEYNCSTLIPAVQRTQAEIHWYRVDELYPQIDESMFEGDRTAILIVNYFGLRGDLLKRFEDYTESIIWDFSQAFFCKRPSDGHTVFYSPRKFLGIPDGGILYGPGFSQITTSLPRSQAYNKVTHLVKRIDTGAESGYLDFKNASRALAEEGLMSMSNFSQTLLTSIDLDKEAVTRLSNYRILHRSFKNINKLYLCDEPSEAPLVYPLLLDSKKSANIRQYLLKNKVYLVKYWPFDGLDFLTEGTRMLSDALLPLPIDQRYGFKEMQKIINLTRDAYEG